MSGFWQRLANRFRVSSIVVMACPALPPQWSDDLAWPLRRLNRKTLRRTISRPLGADEHRGARPSDPLDVEMGSLSPGATTMRAHVRTIRARQNRKHPVG